MNAASVNVAGVWKSVEAIHVNIGGVWKLAFAAATLENFAAGTPWTDEGAATTTYGVNIIFQTDGGLDVTRTINADSLDVDTYSPDPSGLWVRCTHNAGNDMTAGATRATWHALSSARTFTMSYTSGGGNDQITGNFTFELSTDSGGASVVATATIDVRVGETF